MQCHMCPQAPGAGSTQNSAAHAGSTLAPESQWPLWQAQLRARRISGLRLPSQTTHQASAAAAQHRPGPSREQVPRPAQPGQQPVAMHCSALPALAPTVVDLTGSDGSPCDDQLGVGCDSEVRRVADHMHPSMDAVHQSDARQGGDVAYRDAGAALRGRPKSSSTQHRLHCQRPQQPQRPHHSADWDVDQDDAAFQASSRHRQHACHHRHAGSRPADRSGARKRDAAPEAESGSMADRWQMSGGEVSE